MIQPKKLVTTALVYANGPLHLGHLVEQIEADIWVRNNRLNGISCLFISGDDAHGTPIMLSAEKQGITPEALVSSVHAEHRHDSERFLIDFDHYSHTHHPHCITLVQRIFTQLNKAGHIAKKTIMQAYDSEKGLFLPDRYVKGTCPRCKAPDQYGDNCDQCGATYSPMDLIDPISTLSNTAPIEKASEHYFLKLADMQAALHQWINDAPLQSAVKNKLVEWFQAELRDWDISRDAPYFGVPIPGTPDKYFYVWLDAPIGYFGILAEYCAQQDDLTLEPFMDKDSAIELVHFIGKDITYFHGLFWPALLLGAELKTPTAIYAHGFLTVNGKKMSKSKGTFITAAEYLTTLHPEYLRYYLATRLSGSIEDIDLNWEDFMQKINTDLIGKVINIASRCSGFIHKKFDSTLADSLDNEALVVDCLQAKVRIVAYYENRQYSHATSAIMQLADLANQYIAEQAPWQAIKDPAQSTQVHRVCTTALNVFRIIIAYLSPVMPETAARSYAFLDIPALSHWDDLDQPLLGHRIAPYQHLLKRIQAADLPVSAVNQNSE